MIKLLSKKSKLFLIWLCLLISVGVVGCDASTLDNSSKNSGSETQVVDSSDTNESLDKDDSQNADNEDNNVQDVDNEDNSEVSSNEENNDIAATEESELSKSTIAAAKTSTSFTIPKYTGKPYAVINKNVPYFKKSELKKTSYETYAKLDKLGRCGVARANIGKDLMPTGKRGAIGSVKPTGWQTVKYDIVDGKYLYNRCHLIGYQLTGENANKRNLITGTRYMNVDGMLPFENMVADFVKETGKHVLYQVKPIFKGNNLLASGVHMQAKSVEDNGKGISFNIFVYNVQPGIKINYANGKSALANGKTNTATKKPTVTKKPIVTKKPTSNTGTKGTYVLNTNTKKFHKSTCSSAKTIAEKNKKIYKGYRKNLINQGYDPCKRCNP